MALVDAKRSLRRAQALAAMVAASATATASPAAADELEDALTAVNASIVGRWSGRLLTQDLETGDVAGLPIDVSYAVISEDGLDYAYWSERGLTLADYLGDGRYRLHQWPFEEPPSTIDYVVTSASPPDAQGNWSVNEIVSATAPDGSAADWSQLWSLQDGVLSVTRELPPPGAAASGSWVSGYQVTRRAP